VIDTRCAQVGHGLEELRFVSVAAGGHTLGIDVSGGVWVWGRNSSDGGGGHGSTPVPDAGQLGHDVAGRPGRAGGALLAQKADSVASGRYHSAAAAGGAAYTWGLNDQGQLGRGATNAPHPVRLQAVQAFLRCRG
jgi:alpha-tubulin suppressor-like RCC1 family protein